MCEHLLKTVYVSHLPEISVSCMITLNSEKWLKRGEGQDFSSDWVSVCIPSWPQTHNSPASASILVLEINYYSCNRADFLTQKISIELQTCFDFY